MKHLRQYIRNILTETWDPGNWRRGKQVYFNMGEATKAIKDIIAKTESYASGADTEGAREFGKMMADLFISQLEEIEEEERNMWLWFANKHMGFAKEKHRQWKPEYEALHALMGSIFHPELMDK